MNVFATICGTITLLAVIAAEVSAPGAVFVSLSLWFVVALAGYVAVDMAGVGHRPGVLAVPAPSRPLGKGRPPLANAGGSHSVTSPQWPRGPTPLHDSARSSISWE